MNKTDKTVDVLAEYLARWEEEEHRRKTIIGMRQAEERGVVFGNGNILGYDKAEGKCVINQEQAETVRMIFDLYLNGHSANKIKSILETKGRVTSLGHTTWSAQSILAVLRNPFYCGRLEHKFLNGNVIKGKQEKLISEALFDRVQQILDGNHGGYEQAAITPQFPLKGHIYYNGHMLTGYTVKKKNLDYYKYSGKDGSVNVSAKELHAKYSELLDRFNVPMELIPILVGVLKKKFAEKEDTQEDDINAVKKHLATINTYIKTAKKNFAIGNICKEKSMGTQVCCSNNLCGNVSIC